ncbi:MAG: bifunctional DNA primase/polymerase [Candidatus Paceibacterota bacterium]|jgi:hypothetical protein
MIEAVRKYREVGIYCLPTKKDKTPLIARSWKDGFADSDFKEASLIGLICGKTSGGLECIDFDNHFGDATKVLSEFLAIPEVKAIYEAHKLPIESTMNGGYHFIFRCTKNDGNRKIAQRMKDGRPDAIIETRGEGGYFCAYPSEGYKVIRNDILSIETISELERATLIDNACSMNECYPSLIKTEWETGDRPGDKYNESEGSIQEMKDILTGAGWVQVDGYKWRRPGKKEGISATLGKVAPNVFYVFTANAYPFEPMKGYTPFQVLGLLRFNGDFKEAVRSILPEKELMAVSEIEKILHQSRINTSIAIEKPPTILSIKEVETYGTENKRLFTLGNFSCIIGKAKSKKTFLMNLFTSAILTSKHQKLVGGLPPDKRLVLYFDTEQGEYDCYNTIRRVEYMADDEKNNLRGFSLRQFTPLERCQIIEYAFKLWGDKVGFCVIDGIADLANAINDEDEATRVNTMLLRLTKVYRCHIATIIHQNKNDNFATGHLGSSVMKKAEILISVSRSKMGGNISEVSCDLSRGIDFKSFGLDVIDGLPEMVELDDKIVPKNYLEKEDDCPF